MIVITSRSPILTRSLISEAPKSVVAGTLEPVTGAVCRPAEGSVNQPYAVEKTKARRPIPPRKTTKPMILPNRSLLRILCSSVQSCSDFLYPRLPESSHALCPVAPHILLKYPLATARQRDIMRMSLRRARGLRSATRHCAYARRSMGLPSIDAGSVIDGWR